MPTYQALLEQSENHPIEEVGVRLRSLMLWVQKIGRMGEVEEVVDAVIYLNDAMFVTAEVLHTDGGAHAGKW